jgi:caa(3)-type oxidase subunit IV
MFFTLYFCMTGLHALHVIAGMCVLGFLLGKVVRGHIRPAAAYPLAVGAVYWHLVDAIWIFLWPFFYLVPGRRAMSGDADGTSARELFLTWAALMALAALSLALRFAHLGPLGMVAALGIAVVKVVLVGLVFMELAFERASVRLAFAAGLLMIVVMLALMVGDVVTRAVPPLENPPGTEPRTSG